MKFKIKKFKLKKSRKNKDELMTKPMYALLITGILLVLFNQTQIMALKDTAAGLQINSLKIAGEKSLSSIDIDSLKSTAHTVAAVFPVENIVTSDDAVAIMFPTGTPEYGAQLGVSYDEPIESLATLARMYRGLKAEVEQNNPEGFSRFMNLASKPVGISCEYCCGLQTIGIDKKGNSACGCQHNPALLSIALYLSAYTDYSDGEILREVMLWKTLFFPRDMIKAGMSVAGGDTSSLKELPGMVGGC